MLLNQPAGDQLFSHFDNNGMQTHLNASAIWRANKWRHPVLIPVELEWAHYFIRERGVEEHRLARLRGVEFKLPVVACEWPDGTHLIIDGTHRYVAAALDGKPEIKAIIVPEKSWRKFQLRGINDADPAAVVRGPSGIA